MDVNLDGNTITNAYLSGIEGTGTVNLTDATVTLPPDSVTIANLDATGTPSSTTYLRGDGTWSNPTSGGAPVTLTGDAVGTGTGTVPVTVEGLNGTSLAGLASGVLYNTTATGVPSIATANQLASGLTGTTGTVDLSSAILKIPQGTAATLAILTPASGEPYWTTDTKELFLGDGTTVGANRVVKVNSKNIYVSQSTGNDTRATGVSKYDPNIPFATLTAAAAAAASGDIIVALDGAFTDKNVALANNVNWLFYPSVTISSSATANSDAIFAMPASGVVVCSLVGLGDNSFTITGATPGGYIFALYAANTTSGSSITCQGINWTANQTATTGGPGVMAVDMKCAMPYFQGNVTATTVAGPSYFESDAVAFYYASAATTPAVIFGNLTYSTTSTHGALVATGALNYVGTNPLYIYGQCNGAVTSFVGSTGYLCIYGNISNVQSGFDALSLSGGATVEVHGNVYGNGTKAISSIGTGLVTINGNVIESSTSYSSFATTLTVTGNVPITTANTSGTVTWNNYGADENQININTGTNASVAMTFPANSRPNQTLLYSTGQAVTTLTQSGSTFDIGTFPSSLAAGTTKIFKRSTATGHWIIVQ